MLIVSTEILIVNQEMLKVSKEMLIVSTEMLIVNREMLKVSKEMLIVSTEKLIVPTEMPIVNQEKLILTMEMLVLYREMLLFNIETDKSNELNLPKHPKQNKVPLNIISASRLIIKYTFISNFALCQQTK